MFLFGSFIIFSNFLYVQREEKLICDEIKKIFFDSVMHDVATKVIADCFVFFRLEISFEIWINEDEKYWGRKFCKVKVLVVWKDFCLFYIKCYHYQGTAFREWKHSLTVILSFLMPDSRYLVVLNYYPVSNEQYRSWSQQQYKP